MMSAVEASERLIEPVHENHDIANHADGCDAGAMTATESDLGAAFPMRQGRLAAFLSQEPSTRKLRSEGRPL